LVGFLKRIFFIIYNGFGLLYFPLSMIMQFITKPSPISSS